MSMDIRQEYEQLREHSEFVSDIEFDAQTVGGRWVVDEDFGDFVVGMEVATIIYYTTGIVMVSNDWQMCQPIMTCREDVADREWVDIDGYGVIIMDGLPVRSFA